MTTQQPTPIKVTLKHATKSDLPDLVDLQFRSFSHDTLIEQIANPDTPANRQAVLTQHQKHIDEDAGLRLVKAVVNPAADKAEVEEKIVGFCMFYLPSMSKDTPGEVLLPMPLRPRAPPPATVIPTDTIAAPAMKATGNGPISLDRTNIATLIPHRIGLLASLRAASPIGDRGVGYVRYMCVDSAYRRHGIGRSLMDWGCAQFDGEGVDAYLEATTDGEPLYRRYGFEKVDEQVFEIDGEVAARYAIMWRAGKGKNVK